MAVAIMADNPLMTVTIVVAVADVPVMVSRYTGIAADFFGLSRRHIAVAPACLLAMAPSRRMGIAMLTNFMPPVIVAILMMNANPLIVVVTVSITIMMLVTVVTFATIMVFGCGHSAQRKGEYQKQRKTQSAHYAPLKKCRRSGAFYYDAKWRDV